MKVKQGDSSISPAAYAAACEALEGSRRPKATHLSPYEDLIKGIIIITTQTVLNLCLRYQVGQVSTAACNSRLRIFADPNTN